MPTLAVLPEALCAGRSRGGRKEAVAVNCSCLTNAATSGGGEVGSEGVMADEGVGDVETRAEFGIDSVTA